MHGYFLWQSRYEIAIGRSDFSSFYTAAQMLHQGKAHQLYDLKSQEIVQTSILPIGVKERHAILPYTHPPFETVIFLPLAQVSYVPAYWIWFGINIGLLTAIIINLRRNLPFLGEVPFHLWLLAFFSFQPIFVALLQGQDSILLLFCFCLAFAALRRNSDGSAGAWLGLGLFKFQIVLPFIFALLFKRASVLKAFIAVAVLLTLIGATVVGWQGLYNYPGYIVGLEHNAKLHPLVSSEGTASLYGLISEMVGSGHSGLNVTVTLVLSVALLAISAAVCRRGRQSGAQYLNLAFAANVLIALLLGYHIWIHDLSLLILALLLVLENCSSVTFTITKWPRTLGLSCVALLWSPLYIVLIHYHRLGLVSVVLLTLLATVLIHIHQTRNLRLPGNAALHEI
jgi:hypothetical protein